MCYYTKNYFLFWNEIISPLFFADMAKFNKFDITLDFVYDPNIYIKLG